MMNVNEPVVSYLAAWNERDAHRRDVGHEAIDAMIHTAQNMFPGGQWRSTGFRDGQPLPW